MTVYAIALLTITDRERYGDYERGFMEVFAPYGGSVLAVDESPTVKEGLWPHSRTVLLAFPDAAALDRWYHSEAYQALAQHRLAASTGAVTVIKGLGAG